MQVQWFRLWLVRHQFWLSFAIFLSWSDSNKWPSLVLVSQDDRLYGFGAKAFLHRKRHQLFAFWIWAPVVSNAEPSFLSNSLLESVLLMSLELLISSCSFSLPSSFRYLFLPHFYLSHLQLIFQVQIQKPWQYSFEFPFIPHLLLASMRNFPFDSLYWQPTLHSVLGLFLLLHCFYQRCSCSFLKATVLAVSFLAASILPPALILSFFCALLFRSYFSFNFNLR